MPQPIEANREGGDGSVFQSLAEYLRNPVALVSSLSLITLVLYCGTLSFEFVWDDGPQIVNNPIIRSWHNLLRVFGSDLWYHVARHQVYYRPLFVAWSILNYSLFGLHSWGWHLGSVLVHVGAVAAVFWLACRLKLEYWTAALAALIFALHPVHIEAVAWVSAASDPMVTMFFVLSFVAFLKTREPETKNKTVWRIVSLALLFCALLTKEMAVTFTGLVAIYAWLRPADPDKPAVRRAYEAAIAALPYMGVTLVYVLLRTHALHSASQFDPQHGMAQIALTLPSVLAFYLQKLVAPVGLTGLYYLPYVTGAILQKVIIPASVLAGVAAAIWWWGRREKNATITFAGCWLVIGLAPALYLPNFGNGDFVRDRYIYLPSIGFAILAAEGLRRLPTIRQWKAKTVQGWAIAVLCLFYACASIAQQTYWGNNLLVAIRGEQLYPENPYAMVELSSEYSRRGAHDRAIELAQRAVRQHPEYVYGLLALAEANIRAEHYEEGRKWLDQFVSESPEFVHSLTGMASLAGLYGRLGDYGRADSLCSEILTKEPDLYSALYNCGNMRFLSGDYSGAEQLLSRAVRLELLDPAPKFFLGRTLLQDGRNEEAQPYLRQAAAMDPKVWDYHYWLAQSLEKSGNLVGARNEYEHALQLNPDNGETKLRLAALEGK